MNFAPPSKEEKFEFYPGGTYDPKVPTIESVVGYVSGERLTRYTDIARYITALSENSERVLLRTYGESYEGRTLYYLVISAPDHLSAIEEIKENLGKLADPRRLRDEDEREILIRQTPAITWLAYNVHGNEHSTAEAAMVTAYQLAAGLDDTLSHHKIVIPGHVAVLSAQLADDSGWEVLVGPREASGLGPYLKNDWKAA